MIKTFEAWTGSLRDYLAVGDLVDREIVDHMRDSVPPVCNSSTVMQAGEAVNTVNGRNTYTTFVRAHGEVWRYVGCCHAGQTSEPKEVSA